MKLLTTGAALSLLSLALLATACGGGRTSSFSRVDPGKIPTATLPANLPEPLIIEGVPTRAVAAQRRHLHRRVRRLALRDSGEARDDRRRTDGAERPDEQRSRRRAGAAGPRRRVRVPAHRRRRRRSGRRPPRGRRKARRAPRRPPPGPRRGRARRSTWSSPATTPTTSPCASA